ncbi:hypothetical protein BC628DRAFT_1363972 [Trametes gibbosa]|nr:hypothetical protein BC628DRAFT_1363972 [Trametes gibbosa]
MAYRALSVVDIVNEIFEWYEYTMFSAAFASEGSAETERRATLASSARVCRIFHEAAIHVLWSMFDDIYPILHLLPSFHLDPQSDQYLLDGVQEHEWERVLHYTVHVQSLHLGHALSIGPKRLDPASYSVIRRFSERKPIFPNLFRMHWVAELSQPDAMLCFLSPSVEIITVRCDEATAGNPDASTRAEWALALSNITKAFCERNPRLTDLHLHIEDLSPSSIISALLPLNALIEFSISSSQSVDLADVQTLAVMPLLEDLHLPELAGVPNPALQDLSSGFCSLSRLYLERCSPSTDIFACPTLKQFSCTSYRYGGEPLLRQSCAAWLRAFPNLEELNIEVASKTLQDVEPRISLAAAVAPLLGLPSLERLVVRYSTYVPFSVEDADVSTISAALPALTMLILEETSFGRDFPSCTVGVRGLLAVARNCPNLDILVLRRIVVRPEDVADLPVDSLDHGLRVLGVQYGFTEEAERVITNKLFQRLEQKPDIETAQV